MAENPSTGYVWNIKPFKNKECFSLNKAESKFVSSMTSNERRMGMTGKGGTRELTWNVLDTKACRQTIKMAYARPWELDWRSERNFRSVTVGVGKKEMKKPVITSFSRMNMSKGRGEEAWLAVAGKTIKVGYQSNPTTGYKWMIR